MNAQARQRTVRDRVRTQLRTDDDRLVRSVVTRTTLSVVAILLLELGFIASYAGALHAPVPSRIPVAAVAINQLRTGQVFAVMVVEPAQLQLLVANARGLVQFYFVVGLVIGGYLLSVILGLGGGMTPGTLRRGSRRLCPGRRGRGLADELPGTAAGLAHRGAQQNRARRPGRLTQPGYLPGARSH